MTCLPFDPTPGLVWAGVPDGGRARCVPGSEGPAVGGHRASPFLASVGLGRYEVRSQGPPHPDIFLLPNMEPGKFRMSPLGLIHHQPLREQAEDC